MCRNEKRHTTFIVHSTTCYTFNIAARVFHFSPFWTDFASFYCIDALCCCYGMFVCFCHYGRRDLDWADCHFKIVQKVAEEQWLLANIKKKWLQYFILPWFVGRPSVFLTTEIFVQVAVIHTWHRSHSMWKNKQYIGPKSTLINIVYVIRPA